MPLVAVSRVRTAGVPVLTVAMPCTIAGCGLPPPGAPGPCLDVGWLQGSARVFAGGASLVTQESGGLSRPSAVPIIILGVQQRVLAA